MTLISKLYQGCTRFSAHIMLGTPYFDLIFRAYSNWVLAILPFHPVSLLKPQSTRWVFPVSRQRHQDVAPFNGNMRPLFL